MPNFKCLPLFDLPSNRSKSNALLLSLILFPLLPAAAAQECTSNRYDKSANVKQVFDGDTIQLKSGEKVRLIGINTPEMNYDSGKPDPFALQAKQTLTKLVSHKSIKLRYGVDKHDRYKRSLAHIFLDNGENVQATLLRQGLAINIAIPPNLWQQECYQALEKTAKQNKTGLWSHSRYEPIKASDINRKTLGFHHVTGTIKSVKQSRRSIWLNLTDQFALRISKKNQHYFTSTSKDYWQDKTITAKGWISYRNKRYAMHLPHQAAIEIH